MLRFDTARFATAAGWPFNRTRQTRVRLIDQLVVSRRRMRDQRKMLGQLRRGELLELSNAGKVAVALDAEATVKRPPTDLERVIAKRRAEGPTLQSIGKEFGITADHVRIICRRVEDYDRGTALLRDDPSSIEALALLGQVKPLVREILRYRGISRLTDLEGVTMEQMLSWPNVGRQSATVLLNALANLKKTE